MRISDWSSDVCSSDLGERIPEGSVSFALGVAFRRRSLDFKLDDLVAGGRVAVGQPTSAQAQLAAGLGAGRDLQLDLAAERGHADRRAERSEEHTSELQSLMRNSYAVFSLKKKKQQA